MALWMRRMRSEGEAVVMRLKTRRGFAVAYDRDLPTGQFCSNEL